MVPDLISCRVIQQLHFCSVSCRHPGPDVKQRYCVIALAFWPGAQVLTASPALVGVVSSLTPACTSAALVRPSSLQLNRQINPAICDCDSGAAFAPGWTWQAMHFPPAACDPSA
jgi:hypothetical protein